MPWAEVEAAGPRWCSYGAILKPAPSRAIAGRTGRTSERRRARSAVERHQLSQIEFEKVV